MPGNAQCDLSGIVFMVSAYKNLSCAAVDRQEIYAVWQMPCDGA